MRNKIDTVCSISIISMISVCICIGLYGIIAHLALLNPSAVMLQRAQRPRPYMLNLNTHTHTHTHSNLYPKPIPHLRDSE